MHNLSILVFMLVIPVAALAQGPTISDISTDPVLAGTARIRWTTNSLATGQVFYDTLSHPSDTDGSQYAFNTGVDTTADVSLQLRHLDSLIPNTRYYYKLRSSNGGGVTFSAEGSLTTAANGVRTSSLLIIRLNFPNDPSPLPSDSSINTRMATINRLMDDYSFGQSAVSWTIAPGTFTAPHDTDFYKALESISNSRRAEKLAMDASALAAGAGFNTADYFSYVIWIPQLYNWQNGGFTTGVNGVSHMQVNTFSPEYLIFANLLLNGLGASGRANGWVSNDATVFGSAGAAHPSGIADPFDMLGTESLTANLNIKHKSGLGWLLSDNIQTVTTNGTYRVYAHDTETTLNSSRIYGLRMPGYQGIDYWIEFRQSRPANGVLINRGGLLLLDMAPGGTFGDAALSFGTFTDPEGRSVTFTATGGSTPGYVDLTISGLTPGSGGFPKMPGTVWSRGRTGLP